MDKVKTRIIDLRRVIDYDVPTTLYKEKDTGLHFDHWTLFYRLGGTQRIVKLELKTYQDGSFKLENMLRLDANKRPMVRYNEDLIINEQEL